ncbi:MAG: hypothetical protein FWH25_02065 [Syntrophorhabdaceae bacterium]|nr:hypothetical protein [Syntrophorhabdaceae bacterium]
MLNFVGGLLSVVLRKRNALANALGAGFCVGACAVGFVGALALLVARVPAPSLELPWNMPLGGSFIIAADALSSFFLLVIFCVSGVCALYGAQYMAAISVKDNGKETGFSWFFFNMLVAGMAMVCLARNALLFLVAWEAMSISSYFLVMFNDERSEVRKAGWIFMVATHLGTICLLALFVMLGGQSGSLNFADFDIFIASGPTAVSVAFLLALVGFGTKAGLVPLHTWLPEAHSAAPSHVSAVMSGVMIKTGIYGLLRVMTFLGHPQMWWGWTLIAVGLFSGILGILLALAQRDLKRLLAYSSIENIGIITLGIGIGVLGLSVSNITVAALAFAGGLLHIANHALFKALLFLGAGSVRFAMHTLEIDRLGGLSKNMRWTALAFLVGSAAICGLPSLNGFVSKFLVYLASCKFFMSGSIMLVVTGLLSVGGLALIGGMAIVCFTKAYGIIFIGEPRSDEAGKACEVGRLMRVSMLILAVACVLGGLSGPLLIGGMGSVIVSIAGISRAEIAIGLSVGKGSLYHVTFACLVFLLMAGALVLMRRRLLASREVGAVGTWDCGYCRPTARMQYTASSFVQPITNMFSFLRLLRQEFAPPVGALPPKAVFATRTPDVFAESLWRPVFTEIGNFLSRVRVLQHGRIQLYVFYLVLTLLVLLLWGLR